MSENNGDSLDPIERKIAFIVDQQAGFFAGLEEVKALQARTDARLDRAIRLGVLEVRRERVKRRELAEKLDALIDAQIRAEAETASLKEALRDIAQKAEAETASMKAALAEISQKAEAETALLKEAMREATKKSEGETALLKETLREATQKSEAETALLKEAMREMAQAVGQTNRRIDELNGNGNGK
jgi:dynactin complex subunit